MTSGPSASDPEGSAKGAAKRKGKSPVNAKSKRVAKQQIEAEMTQGLSDADDLDSFWETVNEMEAESKAAREGKRGSE